MRKPRIYYLKFIFLSLFLFCNDLSGKEKDSMLYIFHPSRYDTWDYHFLCGASVTRLPIAIVEEEISYSPMAVVNFRLGLPVGLSFNLQFNSNYIANNGNLGLSWTFIDDKFSFAVAGKSSIWFGHLEMDAIRLKSYGLILSPAIIAGYRTNRFLLSAEFETQHSFFWTFSEDEKLGTLREPWAGFGLKFNLEHPLWKNQWIAIALKLNYSKFYYQSWLSYSTIDEFLLYPEIHIGFVL